MAFNFISSEIDSEYLNTLYDGETDILTSVFEEYLATHEEMVAKLRTAFEGHEAQPFKEAVHKYKSTFGYAGFTGISQSMQYIENKCAFVTALNELAADFEAVMIQIENTRPIITAELQRLKSEDSAV
jgi:HPt (histidine-containing phosphotransfer) domain-containing protein